MYGKHLLLIFLSGVIAENEIYFDTFTGKPISNNDLKTRVNENKTFWCTGKYLPCDENEGRRLDGSCNNLNYPTRGPSHTPFATLLPLVFEKDYSPKKTKSGKGLEFRKLRQDTLFEAVIPDQKFSVLSVHFLVFAFANIGSLHDTVNLVIWKPYCCEERGKNDSMCYPMHIRDDDNVHQFSNIRCLNNTIPITFQSEGCLRNKNTTPQRLNSANTFLELGPVYGTDGTFRSFEDGLLKIEMENDMIWPLSQKGANLCLLNQSPAETRCHLVGPPNSLFGISLLYILYHRYHNYIATKLKEVNPCWDDEKLFYTARDINIAQFVQVYYYQLLPELLGKSFMNKNKLLVQKGEFRDLYKENEIPQLLLEHTYVLRWSHTIQPGHLKMYDDKRNYLKNIAVVNLTLHTGYLTLDNNLKSLTQGSYIQPAAKFDYFSDPVLSENGLDILQRAFDIPAADLMKAGLYGLQSYVAYRKLFTGRNYKTFDDLSNDMEPENIEIVKNSYEDVHDIPLIGGVWLEKKVKGGAVPQTFACLLGQQLKKFMRTDRHWYERPNRPNAFTEPQLKEIRKSSIAEMLCSVGDGVTSITPNPFLRISKSNKVTPCDKITSIDYAAWKDSSCQISTSESGTADSTSESDTEDSARE